jgi:hypothetical protein
MQEEGRSNKERRNEIKLMKRKKECGLFAECHLCLNFLIKRIPFHNGTWLRLLVCSVIRSFYVFNLQFSQNTEQCNNWYSLLWHSNAYVIKWWCVDFRCNTASTTIRDWPWMGPGKSCLNAVVVSYNPAHFHLETFRNTSKNLCFYRVWTRYLIFVDPCIII